MRQLTFLLPAIYLAAFCIASFGGPLNVPFIRQEKNGCGAATVAMMHYWNDSTDAHQVYQRLYRGDRNGIPLADMRAYLEEKGFHAFTLRGTKSDLEQHLAKGRPLIVGLKPGKKSPCTLQWSLTPQKTQSGSTTRRESPLSGCRRHSFSSSGSKADNGSCWQRRKYLFA